MAALILPRRLTAQPQAAVQIDPSNPISLGLSFASQPQTLRELVSNTSVPSVGAGTVVTPQGTAYPHTGASTVLDYGVLPGADVPSAFTVLVVLDQVVNSVNYRGMVGKWDSLSSSNAWAMGMNGASGNLQFARWGTGSSVDFGLINTAARLNAQYAVTNDPVLGSAGYQDGVLLGSGGGIAAIGSIADHLRLGLFRNDSNTENFLGNYRLVLIWQRALSATEISSIYANPWQVFKAPPEKLWVASASATVDQPPSQVYLGDESEFAEYPDSDFAAYDFYADANVPNRADVQPPILVELPQAFEWADPNDTEEALWPDYWAQAPPIADFFPDYIRSQDSSDQIEEADEDFTFSADPLGANAAIAADPLYVEDGDDKLEDEELLEGFADAQTPSDDLPQQSISEDATLQPFDAEDEDYAFGDGPLPEDSPQLALVEDANSQLEDFDEDFAFTADPLNADLIPATDQIWAEDATQQLVDVEDEPFEVTFDVVGVDDLPQQGVNEDASTQLEDFDEDFAFSVNPLSVDFVPTVDQIWVEDASTQQEEDEFLEGFSLDPAAGDVFPDGVFVEDAGNQPEDFDEDFGGAFDPLASDFQPDSVFVDDATLQPPDPEDEPFEFSFDGVGADDLPPQGVFDDATLQPPDPEDEPFEFTGDPLSSDDLPQQGLLEDATQQPVDPEDEPFEFSFDTVGPDFVPDAVYVEDATQQPIGPEDEPFEFSLDGVGADNVDVNIVYSELSDNQIDLPEDEAYSFDAAPLPDNVVPPLSTGAHSGYLRQVLIETYEREWEDDRLKREKERAEQLTRQQVTGEKLKPRVVRVKSVRVQPSGVLSQAKLPPVSAGVDRAAEVALSITAQELIFETMTSLYEVEELRRRIEAKVREKRRQEEEMIVEFLIRNNLLG